MHDIYCICSDSSHSRESTEWESDTSSEASHTATAAPSQAMNSAGELVGPHPSFIEIAKPYVFEPKIRECLAAAGVSEAKDDGIRLQGVAWIDSVRKAMHL